LGRSRCEIAGLRDSEIHDDLIILPGERTKNGRPHVVPLALSRCPVNRSNLTMDPLFGFTSTTLTYFALHTWPATKVE